jgi:hypothetical protein
MYTIRENMSCTGYFPICIVALSELRELLLCQVKQSCREQIEHCRRRDRIISYQLSA